MTPILRLLSLMIRDQKRAFARGAALAALVLVMGAALLGLSGWFITATAAAGLAGVGIAFDVFRPSAGVRFLAIGRTGARYGERLLTHDATLRALASLRVRLLSRVLAAPHDALIRLRAGAAMNRLTADVDALDGVPLRLVLPVLAGLVTFALAFAALWWLVDLRLAVLIGIGFPALGAVVFWQAARRARAPSEAAEEASQRFRETLVDLIAARRDLAVYGQLETEAARVARAETARRTAALRLDRLERHAGAALALGAAVLTGAVIWLAGDLVQDDRLSPAVAAIAIFASLALVEAIAPLRRAAADLGRMQTAAHRTAALLDVTPDAPEGDHATGSALPLRFEAVSFAREGAARAVISELSLDLRAGETVALTGPSGSGKSTILLLAAGLLAPARGRVVLGGTTTGDWSEPALRARVTLVSQRSALVRGTIAENLRLGAPGAGDDELRAALDAVALTDVIAAKGGLRARLGPRGAGLSGGESRRLALARALLRRPEVLLLDEPTEGLDRPTAEAVLSGIKGFLPDSAILVAAHREAEREASDRVIALAA